MAHLVIGKRVSKQKLVAMTAQYLKEREASHDEFERAEIEGYLDSIRDFCAFRGGFAYWDAILTMAKESIND